MQRMILGAALLVVSTGAIGEPVISVEAPSEQVTYTDLDLGSMSGKSELQRRISGAAGRVCQFGGMQDMEAFEANVRCYQAALKSGLLQMDQLIAARSSGSTLAAAVLIVSRK